MIVVDIPLEYIMDGILSHSPAAAAIRIPEYLPDTYSIAIVILTLILHWLSTPSPFGRVSALL